MRSKDLKGPKLFLNIDDSTFGYFLRDDDALYCLTHINELLSDQEAQNEETWEDEWFG